MKRKLFLLLCALLTSVGMWATVDWTDKTSLITNPSFETDDAISDLKNCGWATDRVTGWTISPSSSSNAQVGVGNSSSTISNIGYTSFEPYAGDKYFYTRNNWNKNTNYSFSQVITRDGDNLKAGLYKVTCKAATYSSDAAFNTLTLGLKEGTSSAVTHNGIVLNHWNTWGVIIYKRADDTNLTIEVNFIPGYDGNNKHYALLMDDFHLEYISEEDAFTASSSNTIDFSDIINNATIYNHSSNTTMPRGWTAFKHTTGNGHYTEGGPGDTRLEGWNGGNLDIDYYQQITNLPVGSYTVTAATQERAKVGRTYVYAYTEGQEKATGLVNNTPEYDVTTSELKVSNGTMNIGIESTANDWVTADNFRISFLGFDVDAVKSEYETAYSNAETARDAAENANIVGTERTTFEGVITTYTTSVTQSYSWYVGAKEALENATTTFTAARTSYDALVAARTEGATYTTVAWPRASSTKKTALDNAVAAAAPTSATDAVTKTNAIVTAYRQFVESNGLAEGVATAVDYTSTYLAGADPDVNTGWTGGVDTDDRSWEMYTKGDGTQGGRYYDGGWSTSAGANINMTREVTLPAGTYQLQVTARGSESLTAYTMSIGGESVNLPKEGSGADVGTFGHGWSDKFIVFTSDGTTPLTLAIVATSTENQQWISFNRFRLVRLDATWADDTDYENLNAAIAAAEAKTFGFEDGEYAPYANADALTKLVEAKAIDQDANNEQSVVQDLTTYLNTSSNWTANDGDVDIIYNGNFAEPNGHNPKGWTRSNNAWGQQVTGLTAAANDVNEGTTTAWYYNTNGAWEYGKDDVYKMPLAASQTYKLSFKYRSHSNDSNDGMKASVLNGSSEGLKEVSFAENNDATKFITATAYFTTSAAGNYVLSLTQSGNTHLTDVSIERVASTNVTIAETATSAVLPEKYAYADVTLTRTLSASYWNTFSVPFDAEIPSGWTVKEFDSATDNVISFKNAESIVAGKPYLVKPTADAVNPTFDGVIVKNIDGTIVGEGDYKFAGQIYNKDLATDGTIAYLATDGKIMKLTSGGIKGLRAYFIVPTSGPGARIAFIDGEETAINSIDATEPVANGMKDGKYLIEGKIVIVNNGVKYSANGQILK